MAKDNFFPDDYEAPVDVSSFMKFIDGDNTFRVLSSAIVGYEYWNNESKPVRSQTKPEETPADISLNKEGKPTAVKHFWAFLVYNYDVNAVQSLEITQSTVMKGMRSLIENPKWGDPKGYDITVTRTGKDLLTKYAVVPNPHAEVTPEVVEALEKSEIDLSNIFDN